MAIPEGAVEIPHDALEPETLRGLAEEFVTRDGTDYGAVERSLEEKVASLMGQLESGQAKIFFDSKSETVNIVASRDIQA